MERLRGKDILAVGGAAIVGLAVGAAVADIEQRVSERRAIRSRPPRSKVLFLRSRDSSVTTNPKPDNGENEQPDLSAAEGFGFGIG